MIESIIQILKGWYAEIIAALCGMIFIWIMGLLPSKLQYHKRLNFALRISKVISKIDVSIETNELIDIKMVHKILQNFLKNDFIEDVGLQRDLSFNSNKSGATYKISPIIDEEPNRFFITISAFNAFNVGLFGGIKGLTPTISELQLILDSFNNRKETDKITVHITITSRKKSAEKDRM